MQRIHGSLRSSVWGFSRGVSLGALTKADWMWRSCAISANAMSPIAAQILTQFRQGHRPLYCNEFGTVVYLGNQDTSLTRQTVPLEEIEGDTTHMKSRRGS